MFTLWFSAHPDSPPRLRPHDQFDLPSPPLQAPYVPLGRVIKVSRAVARRRIEGRPVECGALPITGANFRTAATRVKACQTNITSRVEDFAAMHRTSAHGSLPAGAPAFLLHYFQSRADSAQALHGLVLITSGDALFLAREQEKRGNQMLSIWWAIAAFLVGGCAGVLVMALMQMAGGLPEQSAYAPDLNGSPW